MEKFSSSKSVPGLIRDLQAEARRFDRRPRAHLHEMARRRIESSQQIQEIIDWAKRDRRWSFTLAEVMNEPVGRPQDLAARLVLAIVDELEEEREVLDADTFETFAAARAE